MSSLTIRDVLRGALDSAHWILDGTMADVDDELANRPAPGSANSIGSAYAHLLLSEDGIVNGLLKGGPPLYVTTWSGRSGVDRNPPPGGEHGEALGEWYRTVKVNLGALREYAKAVYTNTQDYLASLDDEALSREVDSPMGKMPLAQFFEILLTGHCNNLAGEISAIKGAFGRKGYPF